MIADKNLQLASSLDATACSTIGFQTTDNCIDLTQLRDFGAGCPLYARICIRADFTTDAAAAGVTTFAVRVSNGPWVSNNALNPLANGVYDYLLPRIGVSEPFATESLTQGKVICFPINAQAVLVSSGVAPHDAKGNRYVYASAVHFDATTPSAPDLETPTGGLWDLDFVLSIDQGVYTAGSNKQSDGPFYPTNITQV
jgi:hypothetical protein